MGGALAAEHYLMVNDFLDPGYEIIKLDSGRKVYEYSLSYQGCILLDRSAKFMAVALSDRAAFCRSCRRTSSGSEGIDDGEERKAIW